MDEFIKRESVLKCVAEDGYKCEYDLGYWSHNAEFQELIEEIPAADVVKVVRCKDCKYCVIEDKFVYWCSGFCNPARLVSPADFCSHGVSAAD